MKDMGSDEGERKALGARLKEARVYRGFSQEEIGDYLGISRSSVSLMESGARKVESLEIRRLAELYECSVDDLLGGTTEAEEDETSIEMVARAAASLTPEDRDEVLRFAQFLHSRSPEGKRDERSR